MAGTLAPYPVFRAFSPTTGLPLALGMLYSFAAGTDTPQALFAADGVTPLANPVVLDIYGQADVRFGTLAYKLRLEDVDGVIQPNFPVDNVSGFVSAYSLAGTGGASLIGYLAPFTGAVARTQADKNADEINVLDTGAVADGGWSGSAPTGTDNLASFNAALAAAVTRKIWKVRASGVFYLSGKLIIPRGVTLVGGGMAHLPLWVAGIKHGTVLLINGAVGDDCVAFAENAGRTGLRDISVYNTNTNAIRAVCSVVGHLYPHMKNVELSCLRRSPGVGLYLADSLVGALYETLWGDFDNVYGTGTDFGTGTECSLKWGLSIYATSAAKPQNANSFRGGQFAGYFGAALFDGVAGAGSLSNVFHGTKFDMVWLAASHYAPQYQAAASGVFGANSVNCYIVPVVQIMRGSNTLFNGCYFEAAGIPGTYNDGTNGVNPILAVVWNDNATECVGNGLTDCCWNGCFLYDKGAKTLVSPTTDGRRHDTRLACHLGVRQNVAQSVAAYVWVPVTGMVVEFDGGSHIDWDAANNRANVRSAGTYLITGTVAWAGGAWAATIYGWCRVQAGGFTKNGVPCASNGAATPVFTDLNCVLNLAIGDTINFQAFQNQGGNQLTLANDTRLSIVKIG